MIALLKGSFIFAADLVRAIKLPVKMTFLTTSSYGQETVSSGKVQILSDIEEDLSAYDVLIVDDIIDSGLTILIEADYVGFTIEDRFVVGYGLNYGDYYRNVPYVFAVTEKDRSKC